MKTKSGVTCIIIGCIISGRGAACQPNIFHHRTAALRLPVQMDAPRAARPSFTDSLFSQFPLSVLNTYYRWFTQRDIEHRHLAAQPISLVERLRMLRAMR